MPPSKPEIAAIDETLEQIDDSDPSNNKHWEIQTAVINGIRCVRSRYGVYMKSRWTDATFHFCVFGRYGNVLYDLLTQKKSEFTFIDIGANQGLFSLIAAGNSACRNAYAFEPVASNYRYLLANVVINQAQKIIPVNAAVADTAGTARIKTQMGHSGAATLRKSDPLKMGTTSNITTVNAESLKTLLAEAGQCVIKIDVEGFETTVIEQLAESGILARTDILFYEVNEKWTDPAAIQNRLTALGFTGFARSGRDTHYDVIASRPDDKPPASYANGNRS